MPSGPGVIPEARIAQIAASVPAHIGTFLLTSLTQAEAIIAQVARLQTNHVQLVDRVEPGVHEKIRRALLTVRIVQVVHVSGVESIDEARAVAPDVDVILLDSGNPSLAIKELGGTGRAHDWTISRKIVELCGRPVFLAGGIRPHNVAAAIDSVRPYGIDLCSGVRSDGALDATKLEALLSAMRGD
jgi:phosphoribosylanthranilate isomerase